MTMNLPKRSSAKAEKLRRIEQYKAAILAQFENGGDYLEFIDALNQAQALVLTQFQNALYQRYPEDDEPVRH